MEYRPRLVESRLREYLDSFGAVTVVGPRWCGKTATAERSANSSVCLQDDDGRYRRIAGISPKTVLEGERPRLIDEWQEVPGLWDSIRHIVDEESEPGRFILTASAAVDRGRLRHDGTGRFGEIRMRTMSLFEYGESTGEVSLEELFGGKTAVEGTSGHGIDDICRLITRGGWPATAGCSDREAMDILSGYCESIVGYGISAVDGIRRDPRRSGSVLRSLARNTATPVSVKALKRDMEETDGAEIHANTLYGYISALDRLFITDDSPAWMPDMDSGTAVRTTDTRYLTDPSVSAYFLGLDAKSLIYEPDTLRVLFENLVVRDLKVYAQSIGGDVFHYRDKNGLVADAVIKLRNGRWAAAEAELVPDDADRGAAALLKLKSKVDDRYRDRLSFLAVVTSTGYAYTRPDGVHVIPIGCLRN